LKFADDHLLCVVYLVHGIVGTKDLEKGIQKRATNYAVQFKG